MYKGIYIAASGATLKQTQVDIITQNLANANTLGYKRDKISFQQYLLSQMTGKPASDDGRVMSDVSQVMTDFTEGSMVKTGNPLDIAINGKGFFAFEGSRYARRGDLHLDNDGYLVNHSGVKVLGSGGPIQIPPDGRIDISYEGDISVNSILVDKLKVVDFEDITALKKMGEDFFGSEQGVTESQASLRQGYLEISNSDAVKEMVQMIAALREFEAYQKVIQSFDSLAAKVINEVARV